MLVLAVDTSTPAVTAGLVRFHDGAAEVLAARVVVDPRLHAEVLTPGILECLTEVNLTPRDLDAVVVGVGPGPFTGLRVGMATASAFGDALGLPVHGVCSLDAIAAQLSDEPELLVVTDARRREVYSARYSVGVRVSGPDVGAADSVDIGSATAVAGSREHAALFELPLREAISPTPDGLVLAAAHALGSGEAADALVPLYLRRPDAKTIAEREAAKQASR